LALEISLFYRQFTRVFILEMADKNPGQNKDQGAEKRCTR